MELRGWVSIIFEFISLSRSPSGIHRHTFLAMNPRIAECHKFAVAGGGSVKVNCQA